MTDASAAITGANTGQVPTLEEMADRLAITEVITQHSRGVDRADETILKSAYWPEAEVAYGGYNGNAHGFCEILPTGIKRYANTAHRVSNINIALQGGTAKVETYVTAYHYLAAGAEGGPDVDTEMTYIGRYLDTMEKRGNVWKISFRQVVMDWNQNANATAILEGPPFEGLARGTRFPEDPLHKFLTSGF